MMSPKKREKVRKIFAIVCAAMIVVALLASFMLPVVNAATKEEIAAAQKKADQAKADYNKAQKEKEAAIAALNALDSQLSDVETQKEIVEEQIKQTEEDIKIKKKELKVAEKNLTNHEEAFKSRARAMYEHSDIKYVQILFSAESFGDFLSKIDMISQVLEYDDKILKELKAVKEDIKKKKKELEVIYARQQDNKKELEKRSASLQAALAEKQKFMDELAKDEAKYKAVWEAAEASEAALISGNSAAFSYSSNPVAYNGSGFAWPVPAARTITSRYGYRIHPVYGYKKFHSGIDVGAGYGLDIVASADGTVTLATTNGGYGKCVIINHGSGITTLYGHCSSLLVSYGQKVSKGQVIGKVGSTGVSTGPHLHYEVRKNGATTDPLAYIG